MFPKSHIRQNNNVRAVQNTLNSSSSDKVYDRYNYGTEEIHPKLVESSIPINNNRAQENYDPMYVPNNMVGEFSGEGMKILIVVIFIVIGILFYTVFTLLESIISVNHATSKYYKTKTKQILSNESNFNKKIKKKMKQLKRLEKAQKNN